MHAAAAMLILVLVGATGSSASAASLFGEVVARDPTALLPGERFEIALRAEVEAHEQLEIFEGTLRLSGAELDALPSLLVGVPGQSAFVAVAGNQIVASMQPATPPIGTVPLIDLSLVVSPSTSTPSVRMDVAGFGLEPPCTGICDPIRRFDPIPLEFRSEGVSLGTSLTIVPEPATLVLLAIVVGPVLLMACRRGRRSTWSVGILLAAAASTPFGVSADLALETLPHDPTEDASVSLRVCLENAFPSSGFEVRSSVSAQDSSFLVTVEVGSPDPDQIVFPAVEDLDVTEEIGFLQPGPYVFRADVFLDGALVESGDLAFWVGESGDVADFFEDWDVDFYLDRFDNCPLVPNRQIDSDGDGIGDACECGDFDGDGFVNTTDARLAQRCALGQIACGDLCDVNEDGICDTTDARMIQRLAVGQLTKDDLFCAERSALDRAIRSAPRCPL